MPKKKQRADRKQIVYKTILVPLEGTIDGVINYLVGIKNDAIAKGFSPESIRMEHGFDEGVDYISVSGCRFETDAEFKKRMKQLEKGEERETKRKAIKKEQEVKTLTRLAKKYGWPVKNGE
tara:strand:+ start:2552 stop:2914 length:363 start_codon:yes stop_codon:yes gene_type:complete